MLSQSKSTDSMRPARLPESVSERLKSHALRRLASPIHARGEALCGSASDDGLVPDDGSSVKDGQPENRRLVESLAGQVRAMETANRKAVATRPTSCGCEAMDRCLPEGGYSPGTVVEYLRAMPGSGASVLALHAAASAMRSTGGFVVIVDTQHTLYPPAWASCGIDLERVVLVRPQSDGDALWAIDQALRTPAVAAVIADVERIDDRSARRLQLAAERGGGLALLIRPISARRGPSWSEVQWVVRPQSTSRLNPATLGSPDATVHDRRLLVQLARVRAGKAGALLHIRLNATDGTIGEVERHESKGAVHLAAQLANSTRPSRRTSAG